MNHKKCYLCSKAYGKSYYHIKDQFGIMNASRDGLQYSCRKRMQLCAKRTKAQNRKKYLEMNRVYDRHKRRINKFKNALHIVVSTRWSPISVYRGYEL